VWLFLIFENTMYRDGIVVFYAAAGDDPSSWVEASQARFHFTRLARSLNGWPRPGTRTDDAAELVPHSGPFITGAVTRGCTTLRANVHYTFGVGLPAMQQIGNRGSAKRERKCLHARIEKLDLELSIRDWLRLADQLIQPRFGNSAVALLVNVNSVSDARRLSVDEHAKSRGFPSSCRSHDKMKIAGVKAVHDPPAGAVQHDGLFAHRPITR